MHKSYQHGKVTAQESLTVSSIQIKVHMNDLKCLVSSGCITSAESVLITQQSQEELYKIIANNKKLAVEVQ